MDKFEQRLNKNKLVKSAERKKADPSLLPERFLRLKEKQQFHQLAVRPLSRV